MIYSDNIIDTTTMPPIIGEPPTNPTPLFGGKESASIVDEEVEKGVNDLYTSNNTHLQDLYDATDKKSFEIVHAFNLNLTGKKNADGTPVAQWRVDDKLVVFNTYDDWIKLHPKQRAFIVKHYKDFLSDPKNVSVFNDLTLSDDSKLSPFDAINAMYDVIENESRYAKEYAIHNSYKRNAAIAADAKYKAKGHVNLDYASLMFDNNGNYVTKEQYNQVVNERYTKLYTTADIFRYAPAALFYAKELEKEKTIKGYKSQYVNQYSDATDFNNFVLNTYQRFKGNPSYFLQKLTTETENFDNKKRVEFYKSIVLPIKNLNNYRYRNYYDPLTRSYTGLEEAIPFGFSEEEEKTIKSDSEKAFAKIMSDKGISKIKIVKDKEGKETKQTHIPTAEELVGELESGLEQTYERNIEDIVELYNNQEGLNIKSLKDRYQYLVDAGRGGYSLSTALSYKFNLRDEIRAKASGDVGTGNYKAAKTFFRNLEKTKDSNPQILADNFLVSLDVNPMQEVVSVDKENLYVLNDKETDSKYVMSVLIPQISAIFKNPSGAYKLAELEAYNAGLLPTPPENLSETEINKIPKGELIYRGDVSGEDMQEYEAYTFRFDQTFLNEYASDFKNIFFKTKDATFGTEEVDEETNSKMVNDAFQRLKDNGVTFFIKKEYSKNPETKGFIPTKERKNAEEITGLEALLSEDGSIVRRYPRAGTLKIFKDEKAGIWRMSGVYLRLNANGQYETIPIKEETFPIKQEGAVIKKPYDIDKIMKSYVEQLKYNYNQNTQKIKKLIEGGFSISDDIYYRSE